MKKFLFAALLSFCVCFLFCLLLIPVLRKLKAGQNILTYVKEHALKSGTPTMGGVAFVVSASVIFLVLSHPADRLAIVSVCIGIAFMLVGFIDDFLKLKKKKNEGLKPYQKIAFQACIAVIAGFYCYLNDYTLVYFPFTGFALDVGVYMIPLCAFVFIATVNSVNLTDGLDGLAASSSLSFFLCMGILIYLQGEFDELSLLSFSLCGALVAYLIFNTNKASVFMGDTGSLSLGGFVSAIGIFSGNLIYIAIIGFVFVLSSITVIIQVIYYKKTKKRIFLMAPVHHHFQEKGYSECKISYVYAVITLFIGACCILFSN